MKRASFKPIILILGLIFNLNLFGQTITVVPSTTVCKGTQVTLTINGAINWKWDDGTTSPNYIKTVNSSLDVTVELFDENWIKTGELQQHIDVYADPFVDITGNLSICSGESTTLAAVGTGNYLWSNNSTESSITVNPSVTTQYWMELTDGNGCKKRVYKTVTVQENPSGTISGPTQVCKDESFTLTAPAGVSWNWESGASTSQTFTPNPLPGIGTTTYHVVVNNAANCSKEFTHTITVHPFPSAVITGKNKICLGEETTLTAPPADSYLWSTNDTTPSITVSPTSTTDYTVTVTKNGCTSHGLQRVTVNPLPNITITASPSNTICQSGTVTLNASAPDAVSYIWNDGTTGNSKIVKPTTTTNYTVTVENTNGCIASKTITVHVLPLPTGTISGENKVCKGETITLTAPAGSDWYWSSGETTQTIDVSPTSHQTYTVTLTAPNGCTYTTAPHNVTVVNKPGTTITGNNVICKGSSAILTAPEGESWSWAHGPTTREITVTPNASTTYTVTTTSANGCTSEASINVTVNTPPTISISGPTAPICSGTPVTLTASGASTYIWNGTTSGESITVNPTTTTNYTVIGTDANGCEGTQTITVHVLPAPTGTISGATEVCKGNTITLTAPAGSDWQWSSGETTQIINVTPTTNTQYSVTLKSPNGCTYTTPKHNVTVRNLPTITVTGNQTVCAGESTTLTASGAKSYSWSTGSHSSSITVTPTAPSTTYTVTGTDEFGCQASIDVTVTVSTLPNITISGTTEICEGNSTTLTAAGGNTYLWSTGATSASITVSPNSTQEYTVTGTTTGNCSSTASVQVIVNKKPTVTINATKESICVGEEVTLIASGGGTYYWSTGSTANSITVTPTTTTTYSVEVTSEKGCKATATKTITVNSLPTGNITGNLEVCLGGSTTLTATGGKTYLWDDGTTTSSRTFTPLTDMDVSVQIFNEHGCSSTATAHISVVPVPTATITGETFVCRGTSTSLTASSGITYLWNTGAKTQTITVKPTEQTTSYWVDITTSGGCVSRATHTISLHPEVNATINGPSTVCRGDQVVLIASGGNSYKWDNGATGNTLTFTPLTTTTHSVTVTDANGCKGTATWTVTVNTPPTINITGTTTICKGSSTTLTATGAQTYQWSTGATGQILEVSPAATTTYYVVGTDANGCSTQKEVTVTVNNLPTVSISGNNSICSGGSTTLTAAGAITYVWSTGASGSSITVKPTATQDYTVTGFNGQNCSSVSAPFTVTVNPLPTGTINATKSAICIGESVELTASGGVSYKWQHDSSTDPIITVTPSQTTTYIVEITNEKGCKSTISKTIVVNALPTATISGNLTICEGASTTLTASEGKSYYWSTGEISRSISVAPVTNTDFWVEITNAAGCKATATTTVVVNSEPTATIVTNTGGTEICKGSSITLIANGGSNFAWNTGSHEQQITVQPTTTTTYSVNVSNGFGCSATAEITISVIDMPAPTITVSKSTICRGETVTLSSSSATSYKWSPNAGGQTTQTITLTPTSTATYSVTVTNEQGCSNTATTTITVNQLPTPTITGNTNICIGNSTVLTANGGDSYYWETGETSKSITVSPTINTTYRVWAINAEGCESALPAECIVTVNAQPVAEIQGPTSTCKGSSITLKAVGGNTFAWSGGQTSQTITVMPEETTTYTCVVTNGYNCSSTAIKTVTVNPLPIVNITGDLNICVGESTTLIASAPGAVNYVWSGGISQTGPSVTVSPIATTSYTVTVTDNNGCVANKSVTVIVNQLPVIKINGNPNVCAGGMTTLKASAPGAIHYRWLQTGEETASITVSPLINTTYTVEVTNAEGCVSTKDIEVKIISSPQPIINGPAEICENGNAILTASVPIGGAVSYSWSTGQTGSSIVVNPTETTTYTVTAMGNGGCTGTAHHTVTVNSLPQAAIVGNNQVCAGTPIRLIATGGGTYQWDNGSTLQERWVTPETTTTYTVTVTNNKGCSATASHTITTLEKPSPTITGLTHICAGESTTLTAKGGIEYVWENGQEGATRIVTPTVTTTYTVEVTNEDGCKNTANHTVVVLNTPAPVINGVLTICQGDSTTLTASAPAANSYLWSTGEITQSITVAPDVTTIYWCEVTNVAGCTGRVERNVVVLPMPEVTVTGNQDICEGKHTVLTATGAGVGGNYIWNTGETTASINVSPIITTTYTVTAINSNGCESQPADVVVRVHEVPIAKISGDSYICEGGETTLTASGGVRYIWSTGATTSSITITQAGTYTVEVFNSDSCSSFASKTITTIENPDALISASEEYICAGDVVTLTATGGGTYMWNTGQQQAQITVNPLVTTDYSVIVTNESGCEATAEITIHVNEFAEIEGRNMICLGEQTSLTATGCDTYLWSTGETSATINVRPTENTSYWVEGTVRGCVSRANIDVQVFKPIATGRIESAEAVCAEQTITLNAIAEGTNLTYLWNTGATTASIHYTPTPLDVGEQFFNCIITNQGGCDTTVTRTITVKPTPNPVIDGPVITCAGTTTTLTASGGTSYLWSTGATTTSIDVKPLQTTVYTVTAKNDEGCTKTATFTLNVEPLPTPTITGPSSICLGESLILTASDMEPGVPYNSYNWTSTTGRTFTGQTISVNDLVTSETFTVTVLTPNNCEGSASKQVTVNPIPTVTIEGPTVACKNGLVTLRANSPTATSYLWSNGATTANMSFTLTKDTLFSVVVKNAFGCTSDEVAHHVSMEIPFTVEIIAPKNRVCKGDSLILTAQHTAATPVTYVWSTGETTSTIKVGPQIATNYSVTVTNQLGCTATDNFDVNIDELPTPTITGPSAVCVGEHIVLRASDMTPGVPYNSYNWVSSTGNTYIGQEIAISSLDESTSFTVTVTTPNGCEGFATKQVVANPKPTVTISGSTEVCANKQVTLVANSPTATSYLWSTGATSSSINLVVTQDTTITVKVRNSLGCESDEAMIHINMEDPFTATITTPRPIVCKDEPIVLTANHTASSEVTYLWSNGAKTPTITVAPKVTTTYHVTVTNELGCQASASLEVGIDTIVSPTITGPTSICLGDNITLSVSEGYDSYLWEDGTTNRVRVISNPISTKVYTVIVTNTNGCSATASTTVTVTPRPTVGIVGPSVACNGKPITLKANSPTAVRYLWDTGATTSQITVSPTTAHVYTVRVWNASDCASNEASHPVTIADNPVAEIDGRDSICLGESVKLVAKGGSSYLWNIDGQTSSEIFVAPTVTTEYRVTVFNLNGCSDDTTHTVVVLPPPVPKISGRTTMCVGDSVQLTASDGTSTLTTYKWSTGEETQSIWVKPTTSRSYYVTATNRYGCSAISAAHTIAVYQVPTPTISGDTKVCIGQSATLTATGGTAYAWSTGQNTPTIIIPAFALSPVGSHTFYVDVSNAGGCVTRVEHTVEVVPLPNPVLTVRDNPTNICAGETIILEVSGVVDAQSFRWSNGMTGESITVSPTATTTYSVTVTNTNGCEKTVSRTITVNPKPNVTIISTANPVAIGVSGICNQEEVVLTATGGHLNDTYTWEYDGNTQIGQQITVTPTRTTIYNLRVTNLVGCESLFTHKIIVSEPLNPTINGYYNSTGVDSICYGESIRLVATGGIEYRWTGSDLLGPEITVSPTTTTTYELTVKNQAGCEAKITHKVVVKKLPVGIINGKNLICSGEEIELTAVGGVSYRWNTNETSATIRVSPTETTTYSVIITGANGCSIVKEHMVKVSLPPIGKVEGNTTICGSGEFAVLTASGGSAYKWQTGHTTHTITVRPSVTTMYWVDIYNEAGCITRVYTEVKVGQRPTPSITSTGGRILSPTSTEICEGDFVMLTGAGGGPDGTYKWTNTDMTFHATGQSVSVSPTLTTTYYVEVTTAEGCSATASYTVEVLPMERITITPSREKVCPGETIVLRASGSSGYTWELPDGTSISNSVITVTVDRTSTYVVKTINPNGCINKASITIEVVPFPTPTIYGNNTVCLGSSTTLTATGGVKYRWSTGEITESITVTPLQNTTYWVIVSNELDCEKQATIDVTVNPAPEPTITGNTAIYRGQSTTLTASGGVSYVWSNGETTASIVVAPLETTTYYLTATSSNGCKATIPVTVTVSDFHVVISGVKTLCMGESTTLTANGGEEATYIWNTGETTPSITVAPTETTTFSVSVHTAYGPTGTASVTVTVNPVPKVEFNEPSSVCQGETLISIPYLVRSGNPNRYSLIFEEDAIAQGFVNVVSGTLHQGSITLAVPASAAPGNYKAKVAVINPTGCKSSEHEVTISVRSKGMIVQKWNDVLICDNILHKYVGYQWYKNGFKATGATLQYYSELGGFDGDYHVVAKRTDGGTDVSCVLSLHNKQYVIKTNPNPVNKNQMLKVEVPFSDAELFGAEMKIFDMAGKRLFVTNEVFAENDIFIPYNPGVYMIQVTLYGGEVYNAKFIVAK